MSGLPTALYFPYIDLDAGALKGLACLFRGLALLQPVFAVSSSWTEEGERRGWVKVHRPLHVHLDAEGVRALLREYERFGALYQDSGYLAYLKHGGADRLEDEPGYELIRKIKIYGQGDPESDDQETIRGQILLQMAQDLDRQRREIQEALGEVYLKERSIQRDMGLGLEDDQELDVGMEPLPALEEDDFLIPQRLRAWGEMFRALGERSPALLLTDSRVAMECLVEWASTHSGENAGALDKLIQIPAPHFVPKDLAEVARIREALSGLLPWKIFCEKLEGFLREVRGVPWDAPHRREWVVKGRALSGYFEETVLDAMLESVAALEPSWGEGWQQVCLEVVLFPGRQEHDLLEGHRTKSPATAHNGVVVYLEDREA